METIAVASALFSLLGIAWEDYRLRRVRWIYFPVLAAAGMLLSYSMLHSLSLAACYAGINLGLLTLQFALLAGWYLLRDRRWSALAGRIGAGDLLFLAGACFYFSPLNFVVFYILSLFFSLVSHCVLRLLAPGGRGSVPLAGHQALFLLLALAAAGYFHLSLVGDDWLIAKIPEL